MSQISQYSQFIIVADFGAICFGFGYLIGLIMARNEWRDRYNWRTWQMGMGRAAERRAVRF
jgi:hypothetical protein